MHRQLKWFAPPAVERAGCLTGARVCVRSCQSGQFGKDIFFFFLNGTLRQLQVSVEKGPMQLAIQSCFLQLPANLLVEQGEEPKVAEPLLAFRPPNVKQLPGTI